MKTIILPGYSPHNRDWALDIKEKMKLDHEILVYEWGHWPSTSPSAASSWPSGSGSARGSFSLSREVKSILNNIGKQEVNLIGKSVGTRIAMLLAAKIPRQINKVILCGIPTKGKNTDIQRIYSEGLSVLSPTQVLIFQNKKDHFASYLNIKEFIEKINPKIQVVEKPRSDHHYPYPADFQKFLTFHPGS